jgi:hypothetical protein
LEVEEMAVEVEEMAVEVEEMVVVRGQEGLNEASVGMEVELASKLEIKEFHISKGQI